MFDAYRNDDGTAVDDAAALDAWGRAARPVLVQVARRFGSLTTRKELGEEAQVRSGVRTREPVAAWIDDVLDAVALECSVRSEPLLSAFCVQPDGRMGDRYRQIVESLEGTAPADVEMHAATQRVEAHRYHGAVLPVDGGRPTLPPQLAKLRASAPAKTRATRAPSAPKKAPVARKPKKVERVYAVCQTCFLQLPASGRCDNCDE
jgi:hypothetical protein